MAKQPYSNKNFKKKKSKNQRGWLPQCQAFQKWLKGDLHSWLVGQFPVFFPHHTARGWKTPGTTFQVLAKKQWSSVGHCYWVILIRKNREGGFLQKRSTSSQLEVEQLWLFILESLPLPPAGLFEVSVIEQSVVKVIYFSSVNHMLLFLRPHTGCVWHHVGRNLSSFSCWDSHINHPDVEVSADSEISWNSLWSAGIKMYMHAFWLVIWGAVTILNEWRI